MGYLNYRGKQVVWPGRNDPPSTAISVTMTNGQYADAAALITGESLTVGNTFYLTQGGDTVDGALLSAMTTVLGSYISKGVLPYPAFKVLTASTVSFVTLDILEISVANYTSQFDAIDTLLDVTQVYTETSQASTLSSLQSQINTINSLRGKVNDSIEIDSTVDETKKSQLFLDTTGEVLTLKVRTLVDTTWTDTGIEWELA